MGTLRPRKLRQIGQGHWQFGVEAGMGSPMMPPIFSLRPLSPLCLLMTPSKSQMGMEKHETFCGFPRQNPGLYFPALPVSDHTLVVPPGELARQASRGGAPALSPLISRSVSRWIHHGVIKAINKFPDCWIAGGLDLAPIAPCIVQSSSGPTQPSKQCLTSFQEATDPSQSPGLAHVLWPSHCLQVRRVQPFP